ncbi:heat shock protein 70 family [Lipomyces oligophaga]|uniref:heat shock protein 70 family n=1 Tax=Lipomyces oligophaga TaxID=45792 RepID=UPI0034CDBC54
MSGAVGIDLGNANTVIAVARNRGIDVIVNEVSNRSTPSLVAFGSKSRFIGESAKTQEITNLKNTIGSLKRILGRKLSDPEVEYEKKFIPGELVEVDGQVGVKVRFQNEVSTFTSVQLIAMYLSKIKQITQNEIQMPVTDVVLSVPVWYTDVQRRALIDAGHIASLNPVRLINETTAAAISYGVFRTFPDGQTKNVVFVDIGHSSYSVSVVAFKQGELKVLSTAYDMHFGGRDFDYALTEFFADQFKEKYKIDVRENLKGYSRVSTQVERMKKILSANASAPLNVESVMNDVDVSSVLQRAELEELVKPLLDRMVVPLEKAIAESKLKPEEIDSVELIGGSTRIPVIKDTITKAVGKPLSFTLNQDEAIARGCAFVCASHSPTLRVRPYKFEDVNQYSVTFQWASVEDEDLSELEVFPHGNAIPSTKIITLFRSKDFDLEARYTNPSELPGHLGPWIGKWTIKGSKPTEKGDAPAVKIRLRTDHSGLVTVDSAYTAEEVTVEEPIEEPGAEGEEKESSAPVKTKTVKKWVKKDTLSIIHGTTALDASLKQDLLEKENQMIEDDKQVADTEDRKNALEEYIYDMRGKIEDKYAAFSSDDEKAKFRSMLDDAEDWLYGDGEDATKGAYSAKYEELNAVGGVIKGRFLAAENEKKEAEQRRRAEEQRKAEEAQEAAAAAAFAAAQKEKSEKEAASKAAAAEQGVADDVDMKDVD